MTADVRALLQSEKTTRRIDHPYASYSKSGALSCTLCGLTIKSDSLWDFHLRSKGHRGQRTATESQRQQQHTGPQQPISKKRKADEEEAEDVDLDTRKRSKAEEPPVVNDHIIHNASEAVKAKVKNEVSKSTASHDPSAEIVERSPAEPEGTLADASTIPDKPSIPPLDSNVDDEEWAAFERAVATVPSDYAQRVAAATISAPPKTAEELAAEAREEQSKQKGQREVELEEEKDEASEALQRELEEMDELEQRARRLREKREALRAATKQTTSSIDVKSGATIALDDEEEEDEEEDDMAGWLGRT